MLNFFNRVLWYVVTILIIVTGIIFSKKLKYKQFNLKKMLVFLCTKENNSQITVFSSFLMTLAARIGVGSIAGVALAIYLGGPGTVFWIIIISFLTTIICYCETYLGMKYRITDNKISGPFVYMENALNYKLLSKIYSIIMLIACSFGFICIQSNTIVKSVVNNNNNMIICFIIGIILSFFIYIVINDGLKSIINFISKFIPFIIFFYLFFSILIIIINYKNILLATKLIFIDAFKFNNIIYGFIPTVIIGIQRGIFSSEAGLGTCTISSSISDSKDIERVCFVQMIGVYITSLFICGITGLVIVISSINLSTNLDINGIEIVKLIYNSNFGIVGNYIFILMIIFFSFSSIVSCYFDGEVCAKYLKIKNIKIIKFLTILFILIGSITSSSFLWMIIDIFVAVLAIINIIVILKLKDEIV